MPPKEDTPSKNTDRATMERIEKEREDALRRLEWKGEKFKQEQAEIGMMSMSKETANQLSSSGKHGQDARKKKAT